MHVQMAVFHVPKDGNDDRDWEDKAVVRRAPDGSLRFLVLDGAAEAFDTVRWVDQIAASFAPVGRNEPVPALHRDDMALWFGHLQRRWAERPPVLQNLMEERRFHETGSFATMLAGAVTDVDGPRPHWRVMALGDTVLFHVRGDRLLTHFPALTDADFGLRPPGVSTKPGKLAEMVDGLGELAGCLAPGDTLLVATDALAHWIVRRIGRDDAALFRLLRSVNHPDTFAALVADHQEAQEMVNDDVTLLRLTFSDHAPSHLMVCL